MNINVHLASATNAMDNQPSNFQQQADRLTNQANYLPATIETNNTKVAITNYIISDVPIIKFSTVVIGIPTDESFEAMCMHANQKLVAQSLAKLLNHAQCINIKKWVFDTDFANNQCRKSPLEIAAKHSNLPVCKIIIAFLQSKTTLQNIISYLNKYIPAYVEDHDPNTSVICRGFKLAVKHNLQVAEYIYNCVLHKDMLPQIPILSYLPWLYECLKDCKNINMLDFICDKIAELLVEQYRRDPYPRRPFFDSIGYKDMRLCGKYIIDALYEFEKHGRMGLVSYILNQMMMNNYIWEAILYYSSEYLCDFIEQKKFSMVLPLFLPRPPPYAFYYCLYKGEFILNAAAMYWDAKIINWLFTVAKLPLHHKEKFNISFLDYAILNNNYEGAIKLRLLGAKSAVLCETTRHLWKPKSDEEDLYASRIKFFLSYIYPYKPTMRLSQLAALSLGLKYVRAGSSVTRAKVDIGRASKTIANQVDTIKDVFLLYNTGH